ncbi:hypothetical protein [Rhodococcus sp. BS-15]|uniref:hypothetical protein n=1 Tax=Rhodococcus sp. BS-15 TaxID=1304954 RepID=UPI000A540606|nr:hypothetical protein [Rhodococcus sp. BS-15]
MTASRDPIWNKMDRLQELGDVVGQYARLRESVVPETGTEADVVSANPLRAIPPIGGSALPDAFQAMAIDFFRAHPFRPNPPIEGWASPGVLWSTLIDRFSDAARHAGATEFEIDLVVAEAFR